MKNHTDIEQSRKLAEILPLESADMYYTPSTGFRTEPSEVKFGDIKYAHPRSIRCWSLAALLSVLPPIEGFKPVIDLDINQIRYEGKHRDELVVNNENLIDACYEMIMRLNELKLL